MLGKTRLWCPGFIHTSIPMQKPPQQICIMYHHTVSPLNSRLVPAGSAPPQLSQFTYKPEMCFCNLALHWIYFDTFYFSIGFLSTTS